MALRLRWKQGLPWLVLVLGMVGFYLLVVFKSAPVPKPRAEVAWPVRSMSVERGTQAPSVLLYARVDSSQHATLSSGVGAVVSHVAVQDGEHVQAQQLLVTLDDREAQYAVVNTHAKVVEAKAKLAQERILLAQDEAKLSHEKTRLRFQEKEFARKKALLDKGFISQSSYEDEQEELASLRLSYQNHLRHVQLIQEKLNTYEAQVMQAVSQSNQAQLDLRNCRLEAPFDGVVTDMHVVKGERVTKGTPLLQLMSNDDVEARALIPGNVLPEVVEGYKKDTAGLLARGQVNEVPLTLSLARIAARVKQGQVGREAVFKIVNGKGAVVTGEIFPLRLTLPKVKHVFSIPVSALYDDNAVYRINKANRLERVPVTVVGQSNVNDKELVVLVKSTQLLSGDQVVSSQMPNAINGLLVKEASGV